MLFAAGIAFFGPGAESAASNLVGFSDFGAALAFLASFKSL
jgi:hypothetical protein